LKQLHEKNKVLSHQKLKIKEFVNINSQIINQNSLEQIRSLYEYSGSTYTGSS
jgi:hypothetical protein